MLHQTDKAKAAVALARVKEITTTSTMKLKSELGRKFGMGFIRALIVRRYHRSNCRSNHE